MGVLLRCGPLSGHDGEGRALFDGIEVVLQDRGLMVLEGASGSGKSTLLRMMAGLVATPRGMTRELEGRSFEQRELPAWRARVTLLAQDAPVLPGSLEDNLRAPFALKSADDRRYDEARAARLLAAAGLDEIPRDREARSLSGGERHRLALVRGLLWDPPVLLADEPLAGLDPGTTERCWALLQRHAERDGRGVIVVLHDPALAGRNLRRLRLLSGHLETV
jgi:putative ABC transport system ATP-binding protein